jgi:hypothetical protein
MAEEKPQKITRQFIVKEPGLKGKHDTPTVIFRNATGTEQLKIVLGSKSFILSCRATTSRKKKRKNKPLLTPFLFLFPLETTLT